MLQFKQRQQGADELPDRWKIGVDREHVVVYVGLALVVGFAVGFIASRVLMRRDSPALLPPSGQAPARASGSENQPPDFHRVSRVLRADTVEVEDVGTVRMIGIETPDGKAPKEIYAAQGLAFVRPEQFRLGNDFRALEREAVQSMRGVWGPSNPSSALAMSSPASAASGSNTPTLDDRPKKLTPLLPSTIGPNIPSLSGTSPSEQMVLVSGGDRMYHKSGCEFLDKKKHAIALSQAKSEGYTACSRCYASTVLKAP